MTYPTEIIQGYRLALQFLWNAHYWRDERFRDWESAKDFEKLLPMLFRGLVTRRLEPLSEPVSAEQGLFGPSYRVVPSLKIGRISEILVNMQSADAPNLVWEKFSGPFTAQQIKLSLIDLFDWSVMDRRDFRYYKVKIQEFQDRPELIGREGLVDVYEADVMWNVND